MSFAGLGIHLRDLYRLSGAESTISHGGLVVEVKLPEANVFS
ncbi:hypothetical protein [Flindersiella endophytica]